MMRKLRESTGFILWIVIFAFVGLIVVEWGADFSGSGGSRSGDAVGVINGEKIGLKLFQQVLRNTARQQPDDQPADQGALVREIWGETVSNILLRQQIEKLGITVSDKEIALITRSQPPPVVQNLEVFQTDGEFDPAKYSHFLNDPTTFTNARNKSFVMQLEEQVRQQWLSYKLQRLLTETVQVSPPEIRHYFETQSQKVDAEYLFVPASTVSDEEVQVSDSEIQGRYDESQEEYRHPDQVRMSFVVFPKVPNTKDSLGVYEEITNLRSEIESGADFEELARAVSEDQGTAENGGDLGTFGRGRMVAPFEEVAFTLEPGQVSEPGDHAVWLAPHQGGGTAERGWQGGGQSPAYPAAIESLQANARGDFLLGGRISRSRSAGKFRICRGRGGHATQRQRVSRQRQFGPPPRCRHFMDRQSLSRFRDWHLQRGVGAR